ncbi:MAG: protein kinase [bacterium]|nr:protein kinase [bacterium]
MSENPFVVVVVDDNEVNRELYSRYLELEGHRVLPAGDGAEALKLVEQEPVDLVLLDVMMPGIDGFGVLEKLRQEHSPETLPVIMATAKDQSEDVVKAFDLGANDYVTKPLDLRVVAVRVQAQLRAKITARVHKPEPIASVSRIEPGTVLEGKYRLDSLIGQGNFGAVYRATHLTLDREIAVKLLDANLQPGDESVARFQREGVSTCRIEHPNAVSIMDFSVTPAGIPFLVMELLRGAPLEDELNRRGRLTPERCAEILIPVCGVLSEAHALGIIHRDVKPQNIFLHQSRHGEVVKVLDFGIAKLVGGRAADEELTMEDGVIGTPIYMAPERFVKVPYDGRADVYSLGVMLYEMLVGKPPFYLTGTSPLKVIYAHMNEEPRPPSELNPELSEEVEAVVLRALDKDMEQRPTAAEMASELAAALGLEQPEPLAIDDSAADSRIEEATEPVDLTDRAVSTER